MDQQERAEPSSRGGQFLTRGRVSVEIELQLLGNGRMLFAPKLQERGRQPAAVAEEFVDERVAGRTDGDQPAIRMAAGPAMMDHALAGRPTALAAVPIAHEHMFPVAGEVTQGMLALAVAGGTQARNRGLATAGEAE